MSKKPGAVVLAGLRLRFSLRSWTSTYCYPDTISVIDLWVELKQETTGLRIDVLELTNNSHFQIIHIIRFKNAIEFNQQIYGLIDDNILLLPLQN